MFTIQRAREVKTTGVSVMHEDWNLNWNAEKAIYSISLRDVNLKYIRMKTTIGSQVPSGLVSYMSEARMNKKWPFNKSVSAPCQRNETS